MAKKENCPGIEFIEDGWKQHQMELSINQANNSFPSEMCYSLMERYNKKVRSFKSSNIDPGQYLNG